MLNIETRRIALARNVMFGTTDTRKRMQQINARSVENQKRVLALAVKRRIKTVVFAADGTTNKAVLRYDSADRNEMQAIRPRVIVKVSDARGERSLAIVGGLDDESIGSEVTNPAIEIKIVTKILEAIKLCCWLIPSDGKSEK